MVWEGHTDVAQEDCHKRLLSAFMNVWSTLFFRCSRPCVASDKKTHHRTWRCSWEFLNSSDTWTYCGSSEEPRSRLPRTGHSRNLRPAWCACLHSCPRPKELYCPLFHRSEIRRGFTQRSQIYTDSWFIAAKIHERMNSCVCVCVSGGVCFREPISAKMHHYWWANKGPKTPDKQLNTVL